MALPLAEPTLLYINAIKSHLDAVEGELSALRITLRALEFGVRGRMEVEPEKK